MITINKLRSQPWLKSYYEKYMFIGRLVKWEFLKSKVFEANPPGITQTLE